MYCNLIFVFARFNLQICSISLKNHTILCLYMVFALFSFFFDTYPRGNAKDLSLQLSIIFKSFKSKMYLLPKTNQIKFWLLMYNDLTLVKGQTRFSLNLQVCLPCCKKNVSKKYIILTIVK